jgi:hypothetical protein
MKLILTGVIQLEIEVVSFQEDQLAITGILML